MADRLPAPLRIAVLAAVLALAGCGRGDEGNLAALDNKLANADPALTSALEDQIAVDPQLTQQSNKNAVRTPGTPSQAQYPANQGGGTIPAPAPVKADAANAGQHDQIGSAAGGGGGTACAGGAPFDYDMAWAQRLSPAFPAYPGGKITEAAGNNQGACRVRVITFATGDHSQRVLDWYHTRAVRAGYSSEHQVRGEDHILAGAKESDGGAFYLIVTPKGNGSEAALIANNGK